MSSVSSSASSSAFSSMSSANLMSTFLRWRGAACAQTPDSNAARAPRTARVDVRGVAGCHLCDLDAGRRVDPREGLAAERLDRLPVDPCVRSDVELRGEPACVACLRGLELRDRGHRDLLAFSRGRWTCRSTRNCMSSGSGYAEELVRVRHADAAHPARARARSGPCARAPASRSGSTSPEAPRVRGGARRGCRTRRSRTAHLLRAPSCARAPSRPPRPGTSPRAGSRPQHRPRPTSGRGRGSPCSARRPSR